MTGAASCGPESGALASGESLERFAAMTDSLEGLVVTGRELSKAAAADTTVARLGTSSQEIGAVVKELASETTRATEDIAKRVEPIQVDTAGAVEEQSATTQEMSRSVAEAAGGSTEIAQTVAGVVDAASSTSQGAARAQGSAADLARLSGELRALVGRFTV